MRLKLRGRRMKKLLAFIALSPLLTGTAHAVLFTPGGSFTVTGSNTPGTINQSVMLNGGTTTALPGLSLFMITPGGSDAPGAEWVLFHYEATDGLLTGDVNSNWTLNEVGLPANQALDLIRGAVQFDVNGVNAAFNSSPFSDFSPVATLPPDISGFAPGPGLLSPVDSNAIGGPGGLPSLGTFLDPFSQLDGDLAGGVTADEITGYTEALEFSPTVVPGPVVGSGLPGLVVACGGLFVLSRLRRMRFGNGGLKWN